VASGRASINVNGKKTSLPARVPAAVVADTELISSAPRRLNISGVADVVSNITAVNDWYLAHRIKGEWISPLAAELSLLAARRLLDNREVLKEMDVDGVKVLMEAVVLSGASMAIAGSSRPASGAEHLISHALDSIAPRPALHGEQCGLASIFTSYLQGEDWREIKDFLDYLGAPVTLNDLGIEKEVFIKAATEAHRIRPERYTILGDGISEEAALSAAKRTGIIP
ncbi:MAG: iron-containing alcohol dehydrogenase, partial [Thermoplasmata archaeon]|nr:iron-containing alcohol dehydrogenase [Thermoplasmata archaeon]